MRSDLAKLEKQREVFTGIFVRFGTKYGYKGYPEQTILLKNICDTSGKEVTDHVWFNLTKKFDILNLKEGEKVIFAARVKRYTKGYKGHNPDKAMAAPLQQDYKLSHPSKIRRT